MAKKDKPTNEEKLLDRSASRDRFVLDEQRLSYNLMRKDKKLGMLAAFFVLFKSCVGLGMFSYPYAFGKVGVIYGGILTTLLCYLSTYGMYSCINCALQLEEKYQGLHKFPTYQSLCKFLVGRTIGRKSGILMGAIGVFGCVAINGSIIIGGVVEVSEVLSNYFGWEITLIKIAVTGVAIFITIVCLEPERLKPVGYLSGGVIICIGSHSPNLVFLMMGDNARQLFPERINTDVQVDMWKLAGTGVFCGIGGFAYEACGTIFTVKESMREPRKMGRLLAVTFTFIGLLFLGVSTSFYYVYGNQNLDPVAFKIFTDTRPFMHSLSIFFSVVITIFLPLYNISNCELLEEFAIVKWMVALKINDPNARENSSIKYQRDAKETNGTDPSITNTTQNVTLGRTSLKGRPSDTRMSVRTQKLIEEIVASEEEEDKSRPKLLVFRIFIFLATISFAFLTDKVEEVLGFSGAVIIPFICFYIPIWMNILTAKLNNKPLSWGRAVHEYSLLLISVAVQGFGLYYTIWDKLLKDR